MLELQYREPSTVADSTPRPPGTSPRRASSWASWSRGTGLGIGVQPSVDTHWTRPNPRVRKAAWPPGGAVVVVVVDEDDDDDEGGGPPSGCQSGLKLPPGLLVSCVWPEPSMFMTQI